LNDIRTTPAANSGECAARPARHTPQQPQALQDPLALVLRAIAATGYRFTTVTPATHHRRLVHWRDRTADNLRDIFGWNLPFAPTAIAPELLALMDRAGIIVPFGKLLRSGVRIASIGDLLFLHSAYPTLADDAVFFGPDTYRFVRFIQHALQVSEVPEVPEAPDPGEPPANPSFAPLRILDVGCGSGAGGIMAARSCASRVASRFGPHFGPCNAVLPPTLTMNDINPLALRYTALNAQAAGMAATLAPGDALSAVTGEFDLIVCNPPYLDDAAKRTYRHGGTGLGRELSLRIAADALKRLAPGGQLLLYTGVAIIDGIDPFAAELPPLLAEAGCDWSYTEIDPDVFGEELERPAYADADRIAAVGLVATRRGTTP
jgi:methylase of polypeptide subunit release factors